MKTCLIMPPAALESFGKRSDHHMILAHIEDPNYRRFYKHDCVDDHVILDNGAYEGEQVTLEKLINKINLYCPHVVILPDHPYQGGKITYTSSMAALHSLLQDSESTTLPEFMVAPQTGLGDDDFYRWLDVFLCTPNITWIGISKLLKRHSDNIYTRLRIAAHIKAIRPDIRIHALGMWDGDLYEFKLLQDSSFIESLDTAAPIWRGIHESKLDDPQDQETWKRAGFDVDFSYNKALTQRQLDIINHNLEVLGV